MSKYIIRLDDACEKMNVELWSKVEQLLDKYDVKPLVGVIPHCEDRSMDCYKKDEDFWSKVKKWISKKWVIAMHGYNHVYVTACGGLNPVNHRSEFAGLSLEEQKNKIRLGISIFKNNGFEPSVFFAPSHTFDMNTITALKSESNIRIISDTVANRPYCQHGITFVPQQSGKVRKLPFNIVTFCYHPNTMKDIDFIELEDFLKKHKFISFPTETTKRKKSVLDILLGKIYFLRRNKK